MVVECQQGVGTILVVDRETETVLLSKQGSDQQIAVSFDEIEDRKITLNYMQLHLFGCKSSVAILKD